MKTILHLSLFTLSLLAVSSCNDSLDIQQVYEFDLQTMPVPKELAKGETAEIRCELTKAGDYDQALYTIRYFQSDGEGELKLDNGTVLLPNDRYALNKTIFRLYYTSDCEEQQTIDIYIEDNFGQLIQKTFSFQNENSGGGEGES